MEQIQDIQIGCWQDGQLFAPVLQALSAAGCILWEWRIEEAVFSLSPNWSAILGYADQDASLDMTRIVHPEDLQTVKKQISLFARDTKQNVYFEFRVYDQAAQIRWILCKGNPVHWNGNTAARIAGVFIDISTYHMMHQKLADDHQMLIRLVDNLPGMAYRLKRVQGKWDVEYISKGVLNLLGYDRDYFMEHKQAIYDELTAPEDYVRLWEDIDQAIAGREPFQVFYRMRTAEGDLKWVWEQGRALYSKQKIPWALEGFIADITKQKELEIKLHEENIRLRALIQERYNFGNIIGKSPAMQQVYELIEKAASSSANVNIFGESGTGKEMVARMIHELSDRGHKAFVPVNCGAIPESLLESEFFGYKKGAFTGAAADKKGYLAAADGGTLFLDELGSIPLSLQVKLLRVLEGGGYNPLGSQEVLKPDIRIIAATNANLLGLVKEQKVREDFYYRIHVLPVNLPPLRERDGDIPLLIEYFLDKYNPEGRPVGLADELCAALKDYDWPGNVRELENVIQRYVTLGQIDFPGKALPSTRMANTPRSQSIKSLLEVEGLRKSMEAFEKELLLKALDANRWRREKTARMLQITTRTLYRKLRQHQIE